MQRRTRILAWVGGVIAVPIVVVIVFVLTFDWNHAKPYLNARIGDAIGRPFAIDGDLELNWRRDRAHGDWLPRPVFSASDITVANPEWAKEKQFAHLARVEFRLSLLPLFVQRVQVSNMQLFKPTVHLEKQGDKRNNWTFKVAQGGELSAWTLDLGTIGFDAGKITLADPTDKIAVDIEIKPLDKPIPFSEIMGKAATTKAGKELAKSDAQDYAFAFEASGSYNGAQVSSSGKTGGVLALSNSTMPFPLQAETRIGDVRIGLTGTVTNPAALGAVDLHVRISGNSLSHLYPIIGITLPDTPPFKTNGHITGKLRKNASTFTCDDFIGTVGATDLHGSVTYTQKDPRPKLYGKLWSNNLNLADLGPLIGLDTGDKSNASDATPPGGKETMKRPAGGRILPDDPFRTDRWQAMDADIRFNGKQIIRESALPISDMQAHLILDNGKLSLTPIEFGFAGGDVDATIAIDGRTKPMQGTLKANGHHLKLRKLFPEEEKFQSALGEVNGDVALSATGNSVAALLGSSNGEVKMLMRSGMISHELMELAGLNIGNYVVTKLFGDDQVTINCAATDLIATNGVMATRVAVFDTTDALINIDGTINFGNEKIDLDITPHTKGTRIFSLRSPLYVKGTFGDPDVGVHIGKLLLRGGGALALGIFATPAAALLALIAPSKDENTDACTDLLAQMRGGVGAPPPGKKQ